MNTLQSTALTLRADSASRARSSFSFFVRNLLGKRKLSAERLRAIQSDEVSVVTREEKLLWLKWQNFCSGEVLPETSWLKGVAA